MMFEFKVNQNYWYVYELHKSKNDKFIKLNTSYSNACCKLRLNLGGTKFITQEIKYCGKTIKTNVMKYKSNIIMFSQILLYIT